MSSRTLTITLRPDWENALRAAGRQASGATSYQGEQLNFETPEALFQSLPPERWRLLDALIGGDARSLTALAKQVSMDSQAVQRDIDALAALGLVETPTADLAVCPFIDIHIDFRLRQAA